MGLDFLKGVVWFRKKVNVFVFMVGKFVKFYMGIIVDSDYIYVNGIFVGLILYCYFLRKYEIFVNLFKLGENVIVIRVISNDGNGEFVKGKFYKFFIKDY